MVPGGDDHIVSAQSFFGCAAVVNEIDTVSPAQVGRARDGESLTQVAHDQAFLHCRSEIANIQSRFRARRRTKKAVVSATVVCLPSFNTRFGYDLLWMIRIVGQKKAGSDFRLRCGGREVRVVVVALHRTLRRAIVRPRLGRSYARQESGGVFRHRLFRQPFVMTIPIIISQWPPMNRVVDLASAADARRAHNLKAFGIEELDQPSTVRCDPAAGDKRMVHCTQEIGVEAPAARERNPALDVHGAGGHRVPPRSAFEQRNPRSRFGEASCGD